MSENSIEIVSLSKTYQLGELVVPVLKNINLTIKKGEFLSIIDPSGSGKSTLLHLIGGLDHPNEGSIKVENQLLKNLPDRELSRFRNKKIGFIFQDFHLLENLTVEENLGLPLLIKSGQNYLTSQEQQTVGILLKELGLSNRAKHKPNEISGGQKQRVAIGRALINQPEIILADEPTGNLDSQTGQQIINLLKSIHQNRKITLIIITHDQKIADWANRIIQIQDGHITQTSSPQIFTH